MCEKDSEVKQLGKEEASSEAILEGSRGERMEA